MGGGTRRRGPKGKNPEEGRRISHSIRLKPSIAAKLREAAETSHRSLGEEMEFRINKSFEGLFISPESTVLDRLSEAAGINQRTVEDEAERLLMAGLSKASSIEDGSTDDLVAYLQGSFKREVLHCIRKSAVDALANELETSDPSTFKINARSFMAHIISVSREVSVYIDGISSAIDPVQRRKFLQETDRFVEDAIARHTAEPASA